MPVECNPDYNGGMLCRRHYPGDSACTEHGGKAQCLMTPRPKCHCAEPHYLPAWHCPVHGDVVVPMD